MHLLVSKIQRRYQSLIPDEEVNTIIAPRSSSKEPRPLSAWLGTNAEQKNIRLPQIAYNERQETIEEYKWGVQRNNEAIMQTNTGMINSARL